MVSSTLDVKSCQELGVKHKRQKFDISESEDATHVYIKVDNPRSLSPKWEGPYAIVNRPSRSQITVDIGRFKDNTPRLQTYHWSSAKVAHMREGATTGQRPQLGRRPKPSPSTSSDATPESAPANVSNHTDEVNNVDPSLFGPPEEIPEPAEIQTRSTRPVRSTRNQNPIYK